jgi:hypothetical protein
MKLLGLIKLYVNENCREVSIRQYLSEKLPTQNGVCSTQLWAEAVNTARYIKNRSPHSALIGEIPLEIWSETKVDLSNLHVFGCKVYMHIPKIKRHSKWEPKETMFVGYCDNKKDFRLYDPRTRNIE